MIVVMHRQRSEKLAREFVSALREEVGNTPPWGDLAPSEREALTRAFDGLIQDGLIGERPPARF